MNKSFKGMAIASAVAGMFAFTANAAEAPAAPAKDSKATSAKVQCLGVNECKGKGTCGGANGCAGKNDCKGKGTLMMTEADCKAKNGTVVTSKGMAPAPAAGAKKEEKKDEKK